VFGSGGGWRHREEGALMSFGIADETGDIMVLQQRIGEYLGRGKAGRGSEEQTAADMGLAYCSSAIEAAQSEICSRWLSSSVMTDI
jgi:hypothetical protein